MIQQYFHHCISRDFAFLKQSPRYVWLCDPVPKETDSSQAAATHVTKPSRRAWVLAKASPVGSAAIVHFTVDGAVEATS